MPLIQAVSFNIGIEITAADPDLQVLAKTVSHTGSFLLLLTDGARHFINESSVCICYLSREDSGTEKTVRVARKEGLQVINIAGKAGLQIKVKRFT